MVSLLKNPYLVLVAVLLLIASSSSHPTSNGGYTGAPGDGVCAQCHSGTNPALDGEISIDGVPASITAGQLYNVTVTVSNPNLAANRAGFQIVALNQSNTNAGNFTNPSVASSIKTSAGKRYFGHAPAVPFSGNTMLTWTVDWTAPASGSGLITFYGGSVIANGNSGSSGDRFVVTQASGTLSGSSTPLSVTLTDVTNVSCNGGIDGAATAQPSGGSPNYSYAWNNGETTATASNLPAGLARVTVTDNVGATATASVNITQPAPIVVNVISTQSPTCFNSGDGAIIVSATGGTGGFLYDWSNGLSGASIGGLSGGTYEVTVTDFNNCTRVKQVILASPPTIEITSAFIQNVNCFGQSTGSIGIFTAGGTGSLETTWSNGQTGEDISNLAAGFYTASVTDDNGCFITETYQITQPAMLNPTINVTTPISCNGGSNGVLAVSVSGGTSPYNHLWSNGSTSNTATGLTAGTYIVTVTDNKGCVSVRQSTLSNPAPIAVSTAATTNASCPGVANGSASINISGGKSPYTVNWSNGSTGTMLNNVTSGTYPLTVTDNAGCTATSQVVIGSNQSAVLAVDSIVNPVCFGASNGSIDISATNAIGYTINWNNGDTGSVLINLPAGIYTAQATNPQGCISNVLSVTLVQPQAIQAVTDTIQQITCFGLTNGAIQTEFSGGTGVLQYAWSNGTNAASLSNLGAGTYTLTVSDANGCSAQKSYLIVEPADIKIDSFDIVNPVCFGLSTGIITIYPSGGTGILTANWAGGFTGNMLNNLQAGTFTTTITDVNGCIESDTFTVTSPSEIMANDSLNNETSPGLANGSIYCETSGGLSPYGYLWSTGDTTSFIDSLAPGLYLLTITDQLGCSRSFQFNVQTGDCALAVNYDVTQVSCFGGNNGAVTLEITNGLSPYMVNNPTSGLEAGTYNYVITDAAGCTFTIDDVVVTQPALLVAMLDSVINASGPNIPDGGIDVSISGGTPTFGYEWRDSADSLVSTLQDASSLLPGLYFLQVIDANGCIAVRDSIEVGFTSSIQSEDKSFVLFNPNPFDSYLNVKSNDLPLKVVFYDLSGRILTSAVLDGQSDITINSDDWASGMYIARFSFPSGKLKSVKLVKY